MIEKNYRSAKEGEAGYRSGITAGTGEETGSDKTGSRPVRAFLVGVNLKDDPDFAYSLEELSSLEEACNMEVVGVETQNVSQINAGVYVGTGKVDEIKAAAHMLEADVVVFDNTLTPMQHKNLTEIIDRPVYDRTGLIL